MMFLWQQFMDEPTPKRISSCIFVEVIGDPDRSKKVGLPVARIALDATYFEQGLEDEHFNLAAVLLLDDGKLSLTIAWASDIPENDFFFGVVLVGQELVELMDHATSVFRSPPWSWKGGSLQWFGFDMSVPESFLRMSA